MYFDMLSKSLILVVLCCGFVSANPIQKNGNAAQQSAQDVNIGLWLQDAHEGIKQTLKHTIQPFEKTYYSLVEAGKSCQEYNKDKIEQLRSVFHKVIDNGREQLHDVENIVLTNVIGNLQNAVEHPSTRNPAIVQGNHGMNQMVQAGQQTVDNGEQNLQELYSQQTNTANDKINQLKNSAWSGINGAGQHAQGLFNGQIKNMKPNNNGGFTLGTGAFSKFRAGLGDSINNNVNQATSDLQNQFNNYVSSGTKYTDKLGAGAQTVFNDGVGNVEENANKAQDTLNGFLNTDTATGFFNNLGHTMQGAVKNGVENVQGNLNQWGSKGSKLGEGIMNKFGDNTQDDLNSKKNTFENVQGQLSQWGNGFGLPEGANKFGNQVHGAVNNGGHEVQHQFNQIVPSSNNFGQGSHEGIVYDKKSTLDTVGKQLAAAVAALMNNIQQNLMQWKSVAENVLANGRNNGGYQTQSINQGMSNNRGKVKHSLKSLKPDVDEGASNIQGSVGQGMANAHEGLNDIQENFGKRPNTDNIQERIGQGMANAHEGLNNIQGNFGKLPNVDNIQERIGQGMANAHEGLNNIQGNFGKLPNVDNIQERIGQGMANAHEGLNNIQGNFGKLPNVDKIQETVGQGMTNAHGALNNIQENFGKLPNVDNIQESIGQGMANAHEGLKNIQANFGERPNTDNIQQSIGQGMTNTHGALNNIQGNFGKLPNVDNIQESIGQGMANAHEGLKNIQGNFGKRPNNDNIQESVGQGMTNAHEGLNNIQGDFGKLQNVDNIQENIGQGMTNAHDMLNNIQGSFGKLPNVANIQETIGQGRLPNIPDALSNIQGSFGKLPNIANIQENIGKGRLPNTPDVLNNIQGSFGKLPNIAEGIYGNFGKFPNSFGNIFNMPGATGYMPKIDEGLKVPNNLAEDDARFTKLGQKVGGSIGGGFDKFTNNLLTGDDRFTKLGQKVGGSIGGGFDNVTNVFGNMWRSATSVFGV